MASQEVLPAAARRADRQESQHSLPTSTRRKKTKRDKSSDKQDIIGEKENKKGHHKKHQQPEVVTQSFAGNEYSGIMKTDYLGCRSLEGVSRYTWASGIKYEGPFVASHIEGRGKFTWPDGSVYEGEINNGKRHGEGVYMGADGMTKYEGQWVQGKRHGTGKLSYDIIGEAHYYGDWQDGWKHGEGRQVWPSGNVYEGQWRFGKMSGQGTMTWKDGGTFEQYTGNWEDDNPQGIGEHTYHAPEQARPDSSGKEGPAQQMNNRYHGSWNRGVRHGEGSFFYANGAQYCGSWLDNIKQGEGRYTFDDGRVYSGPFVNDQMKDYSAPDSSARAALNIGGEDNPVRRCIDVSDLEIFAMPPGVGNVTKGPDASQDVMREVHNTLLRYLGELKTFYNQYRKILQRSGDDPFVLSLHQLWIFARDYDLLTPGLSLSSLNRCILSGPRHQQETAGDEEMQELRPLTPRNSEPQVPKKEQMLRLGSKDGKTDDLRDVDPSESESVRPSQPSGIGGYSVIEQSEVGSSVPSSSNPSSPPTPTGEEALPEGEPNADLEQREISPYPASPVSRDPASPDQFNRPTLRSSATQNFQGSVFNAVQPLYTKFWRREGAGDAVDIHSPRVLVMFRHFLEMFVRVAIVRYPNEKGLEQQIRRLFKDTLVPRLGQSPSSHSVFEFLLDSNVSEVFNVFEGQLWQLFKEHAVGDGVYGQPQWISQAAVELATQNAESADEIARSQTLSTSGAFTKSARKPTPDVSEVSPPAHVRTRRRGYGGQQRRVHVKARVNVTVRVKDVLRLLDSAGFLMPPTPDEKYPPFLTDIHSEVFPAASPVDPNATSSDMGPITDLAGLKDRLSPASPADSSQQEMAAKASNLGDSSENPLQKVEKTVAGSARSSVSHGFGALTSGNPRDSGAVGDKSPGGLPRASAASNNSHGGSERASAAIESQAAPVDEASTSEVLTCDFKLTTLEVLRLIVEVSSPDSIQKLCWAVRGEESAAEERIALLDFAESELAFCEFQRLLLRISELKTQQHLDPALAERLPRHRRLQGFLAHVFLPSLSGRYEPPSSPAPPEVPEPAAAADGEEPPAATAEAGGAEEPAAPAADLGASGPLNLENKKPFELWQGFDGEDLHLQEETSAMRQWPEEYAESVGAW